MTQKQQKHPKILFEDKDVLINESEVQIKWYFFPTTGSKVIPFQKIKNIQYGDLDVLNGGGRLWGMSVLKWGYWFAGDLDRWSRDHFIAIHTDSVIKKAFTTANHKKLWRQWQNDHPNQAQKSTEQTPLAQNSTNQQLRTQKHQD